MASVLRFYKRHGIGLVLSVGRFFLFLCSSGIDFVQFYYTCGLYKSFLSYLLVALSGLPLNP